MQTVTKHILVCLMDLWNTIADNFVSNDIVESQPISPHLYDEQYKPMRREAFAGGKEKILRP